MWQVCPKLNFDARRDFQSSLKIYERMFGDKPDADNQDQAQEKIIEVDEVEMEGSNAEDNVSQTSFFQQGNQPQEKKLSAGMKRDKESFIQKLQSLNKKIIEEEYQNSRQLQNRKGEFIEYGNEV